MALLNMFIGAAQKESMELLVVFVQVGDASQSIWESLTYSTEKGWCTVSLSTIGKGIIREWNQNN